VTAGTSRDTLVLRYNDAEGLDEAFAAHCGRIAGVIFEPVVGNMGVVVPSAEFLRVLRELTRQHGALLICDEVMTGFRVSYGGAQQLLGIEPDNTTLGKIVGGGLPVGAYGGRVEIMDHVLPAGKVFQAGTLSGNPLATAAGTAMLRALRDDPPYVRLESLSARLESGLRAAAESAGVAHQVARVGSMLTLFFASGPVTDWDTASRCDTERFAKYFWGMLERGVYLPCSQYEALFVSAAHSEADIDATVGAAREALAESR
jgi:glutamate-1-semialdehyde 2,1-aminomutase